MPELTNVLFLGDCNVQSGNRILLPEEVQEKVPPDHPGLRDALGWAVDTSFSLPIISNKKNRIRNKPRYNKTDSTAFPRPTIPGKFRKGGEVPRTAQIETEKGNTLFFVATEGMISGDTRICYILTKDRLRDVIPDPGVWKNTVDNLHRIMDSSLPEDLIPDKRVLETSSNPPPIRPSENEIKAEILGIAQDAGVPQLGSKCPNCERAWEESKFRYASSISVSSIQAQGRKDYLIDATPDLRFQTTGEYLRGIFLTHGHFGQIAGLLYLGIEALNTNLMPIYCTESIQEYLRGSGPFEKLVGREQIKFQTIEAGDKIEVDGIIFEPRHVPHDYVDTDTLAYMIEGKRKKLFYLIDIDYWTDEAIDSVREADIAIVDGCFWNEDELDQREPGYYSDQAEVPHPPIPETMELMSDLNTNILFTNVNHTNPVLRKDSEERQKVENNGFQIAERGNEFQL